jgi:hypothetical protein
MKGESSLIIEISLVNYKKKKKKEKKRNLRCPQLLRLTANSTGPTTG